MIRGSWLSSFTFRRLVLGALVVLSTLSSIAQDLPPSMQRFLDFEQNRKVLDGSDPNVFSKDSNEQNVRYKPEPGNTFEVQSYWVDAEAMVGIQAESLSEGLKKDFTRVRNGKQQYRLLVHPESTNFYRDIIKSAEAAEVFIAAPTASGRTVLAWKRGKEKSPFFVKLSLDAKVGEVLRLVKSGEVVRSIGTQRLLDKAVDTFPRNVSFMRETFGLMPASQGPGGMIIREIPREMLSGKKTYMPLFSIYGTPDRKTPPLIAEMINTSGMKPRQFVEERIMRPFVKQYLEMAINHGMSMEAHGQNLLIGIGRNGLPDGTFMHRDFGGFNIDLDYRRKANLPMPDTLPTITTETKDYFQDAHKKILGSNFGDYFGRTVVYDFEKRIPLWGKKKWIEKETIPEGDLYRTFLSMFDDEYEKKTGMPSQIKGHANRIGSAIERARTQHLAEVEQAKKNAKLTETDVQPARGFSEHTPESPITTSENITKSSAPVLESIHSHTKSAQPVLNVGAEIAPVPATVAPTNAHPNTGMERLNRISSSPKFAGAFVGLGLLQAGMGLEQGSPSSVATGLGISALGTADNTFDFVSALRNKEFVGRMAKVRSGVAVAGRTLLGASAVMSTADAGHAFAEGDYDRAVKSTTAATVTGAATARATAEYVAKKASGNLAANAGRITGSRALGLVGGPYTLAALAVGEIGAMGSEMRADKYYGKAEQAMSAENQHRVTYLDHAGRKGPSILSQTGVDASVLRIKRLKSESAPSSAWALESDSLVRTMAWNKATGNVQGLQKMNGEDLGAESFWGSGLQSWPLNLREWCAKQENRKHCYGATLSQSQTWGGYGGTSSTGYDASILKPAQVVMAAYLNVESEKLAQEYKTAFDLGKSNLAFAKEQNSYENALHQLASHASSKEDIAAELTTHLLAHPNVLRLKQSAVTQANVQKIVVGAGVSERELSSNKVATHTLRKLSQELSAKALSEEELSKKVGLVVLIAKMPQGIEISSEKADELYARINESDYLNQEIEVIYQSFLALEKKPGGSAPHMVEGLSQPGHAQ